MMRRLAPEIPVSGPPVTLPRELGEILAAGWILGLGGSLILAPSDRIVNRSRPVPPEEIGEFEYENNDFGVPADDLAALVSAFRPRVTSDGPLIDDDQADYRDPDGQYPAEVMGFLAGMARRGLSFAAQALSLAGEQRLPCAPDLIAIVSTGIAGDVLVHGTTVKFTTARGLPSRSFDLHWFDDLERFKLEAMAILTMSDLAGLP
jgi:hypothetical protein